MIYGSGIVWCGPISCSSWWALHNTTAYFVLKYQFSLDDTGRTLVGKLSFSTTRRNRSWGHQAQSPCAIATWNIASPPRHLLHRLFMPAKITSTSMQSSLVGLSTRNHQWRKPIPNCHAEHCPLHSYMYRIWSCASKFSFSRSSCLLNSLLPVPKPSRTSQSWMRWGISLGGLCLPISTIIIPLQLSLSTVLVAGEKLCKPLSNFPGIVVANEETLVKDDVRKQREKIHGCMYLQAIGIWIWRKTISCHLFFMPMLFVHLCCHRSWLRLPSWSAITGSCWNCANRWPCWRKRSVCDRFLSWRTRHHIFVTLVIRSSCRIVSNAS